MLTQKSQKSLKSFVCEKCDYITCKKNDFNKHLLSLKHLNTDTMFTNVDNMSQKVANEEKYKCKCNKEYSHRQSLYVHKKTCSFLHNEQQSEPQTNNNMNDNVNHNNQLKCTYDIADKDNLILMLVKQNAELIKETSDFKSMMVEQQNMMMEVIKNGTHNTNSHNNSHNKAFNLNLFLNETCKDAMNINDFVESIKLQVSDLENVGEIGFVEGISNIIVKNLNALDITQRPIHCTDKKRETIYIKDENVWEKDESQCKIRRMIKKVVSKNQRLIPKFKEQNPEYNKSYSKVSDKYNKLIIESMGGSGDNDAEKEDKIVRNIVKNVVVDKSV